MTEENTQDAPKVSLPEGSVKTEHTTLGGLRLNAKHGVGKTGQGPKISWEHPIFGGQVKKLPGGKFSEAGLKVPANKKLWAELNDPGLIEDEDVTIIQTKGPEYWDFTSILPGHVGTAGIVKPGDASPTHSGGRYDASGAIQGKLENTAVSIACANATAKAPVTLEDVLAVLESFTAETVMAISRVSRALYDSSYGSGTTAPAVKQVDTPEDEPGSAEPADDLDDDIPF